MADDANNTAASVDAPVAATPAEPQSVTKADADTAAPTENGETVTEAAPATNGETAEQGADAFDTPASKDKKRKSTGSVAEPKGKKLNKKKSMPTLHLDCKPGEFYWARLKGYPPWPSVVCDEAMLPESLLATRPVSTARPDGSIRDDFKEGGKNAKERTFPIMFLSTNEFQWMINTNLTPLDPAECKNPTNTKMTKALQEAWKIASEDHDLAYFKDILAAWQEEEETFRKQEEEAQAEAERVAAEKAAKAEQNAKDDAAGKSKKKARKSKAADGDVDMEDAETPKSSKKRKKDGESDGDGAKPKKTPKVTKLNAPKTPSGGDASASKKSASTKSKKVVTAPKQEEEDEAKPQLSEAEKQQQREKAVLYLRHRLQKGFLSREQAPQDAEMPGMADFFTQLENYENLEPAIIRNTKIHKVLKAIVKLAQVPRDDEYHFRKRSADLLGVWNKNMDADGGDAAAATAAPTSAEDTKAPELNGESKTPAPAAESKDTEEDATTGAEKDTEKTEEKAEENADQIEQKVEGKADAVAETPAPVDAADAKEDGTATASADVDMEETPAAA